MATTNVDHLHIVPRVVALARGLRHYFTGTPCIRNHISLRAASSKRCLACGRELRRAAYAKDPIAARESGRKSMEKWRKANPEIERARTAAWQAANPGKLREAKRRRRKAQQMRTPSWFDEFDQFVSEAAHELAALRSAGGIEWHVDHLVPLLARAACGLHCGANLQVIPAKLNKRKGNKLWSCEPGAWIAFI